MEKVKIEIIDHFNNKGYNFKNCLKREFIKNENITSNPRIYVYRDILIYEMFKELSWSNDQIFDNVENPLQLIETTLFNHLNA
jgi:hypothetical protein